MAQQITAPEHFYGLLPSTELIVLVAYDGAYGRPNLPYDYLKESLSDVKFAEIDLGQYSDIVQQYVLKPNTVLFLKNGAPVGPTGVPAAPGPIEAEASQLI